MNTTTHKTPTLNPYAPPQTNVVSPTINQLEYDGKILSVTHPAILPKYCIKCGKACSEKQKIKKLTWVNPWWILSFFVFGILYLFIHLAVSKRLTISYSLCHEHEAKEKKKKMILWSVFLLSVVLMSLGNILSSQEQPIGSILLGSGILIFLFLVLAAIFIPKLLFIKKAKHTKHLESERPYVFHLSGIDKRFVTAAKIAQKY